MLEGGFILRNIPKFSSDNTPYEKIGSEVKKLDIPFDIPDSWEWVRLSTISSYVTKGTTPRGGNVAYTDSGIGFLRAENILGFDHIDLSCLKYVSKENHTNHLKRSILQKDDILITIAGTLGRTGIVTNEELPLNVNQAVAIVRLVSNNNLNLKYIIYAINEPNIQKRLIVQKKITAIPNLTLEIISNCMLPIPPLSEQQRIVDKIEELFPIINSL